jgi:protease-4
VWAGRDAKRLGLVDNLGSLNEAIAAAAKRAKLTEGKYELDYREPKKSFAQELLANFKVWGAGVMIRASGVDPATLAFAQGVRRDFGPVEREVARFNRLAVADRLYAHCFCTPY